MGGKRRERGEAASLLLRCLSNSGRYCRGYDAWFCCMRSPYSAIRRFTCGYEMCSYNLWLPSVMCEVSVHEFTGQFCKISFADMVDLHPFVVCVTFVTSTVTIRFIIWDFLRLGLPVQFFRFAPTARFSAIASFCIARRADPALVVVKKKNPLPKKKERGRSRRTISLALAWMAFDCHC